MTEYALATNESIVEDDERIILYTHQKSMCEFSEKHKSDLDAWNVSMPNNMQIKLGDTTYKWMPLGQFNTANVWCWAWKIFPQDDFTLLKEMYTNLPLKYQTPDIVEFSNDLCIKMLIAHLQNQLKCDYIFMMPYVNAEMLVLALFTH